MSIWTSTIRRYINKQSIKNCIAASKQFISNKNMLARVRWARLDQNRANNQ